VFALTRQTCSNSRRVLVPLLLSFALVLPWATVASATGPGGWDHLGNGGSSAALQGTVRVLYPASPTRLIAGGVFLNAGGHANADYLAAWDGSHWSSIGTPLNGAVNAIAFDGSHIIVGGIFTNAGGHQNADYLARLGPSGWEPFCNASGPAFNGAVAALQVIGSTLYVGGAFQNGAGIASANYLLACNLTTGASSSTVASQSDAFSGGIYALTADGNGNLYAGGGFSNLAHISGADNVAYLDTSGSGSPGSWHAMGSGTTSTGGAVTGFVRALTVQGGNVIVSTDATDIAGIARADHVARWDGVSWSAMGTNTAGTNGWFPASTFIYGMTTWGSLVFVTGSFQNANADSHADSIAFFDGTAWHPIGSDGAGNGPWSGNGLALAIFQGALHAAGNFTSAGGDSHAQYLAQFSIRRADSRIGLTRAGHLAGNGVYDARGVGESKTISVRRGHTGTFFVDVQNDGLIAAAFTVVGTGSAKGFSVKYFNGTKNVTSAVRAGSFSTGTLARGGHLTLKMVVKVSANSVKTCSFLTKAKSGRARDDDAVKAKIKAT
jgi:hypothetical protein